MFYLLNKFLLYIYPKVLFKNQITLKLCRSSNGFSSKPIFRPPNENFRVPIRAQAFPEFFEADEILLLVLMILTNTICIYKSCTLITKEQLLWIISWNYFSIMLIMLPLPFRPAPGYDLKIPIHVLSLLCCSAWC